MSAAPALALADMRSPERAPAAPGSTGGDDSSGGSGAPTTAAQQQQQALDASLAFAQRQLQPTVVPAGAASGSSTGSSSGSGSGGAGVPRRASPSLQAQQPPAAFYPSLHFNFNGTTSMNEAVQQQQQQQQSTLDYTQTQPQLQLQPLSLQQQQTPSAFPLASAQQSFGFHPNDSSFHSRAGAGSPLRAQVLADASFRSTTAGMGAGGTSLTHSQLLLGTPTPSVLIARELQPKNAAVMSEMLQKAREGLHKMGAELETERQRRQAAERDLAEARRELSNERLAGSSSVHNAQLSHDKENRLLRELAAQKLLESSLRAQASEESEALAAEKEERVRLTERLERLGAEQRSTNEQLRQREEELAALRRQHAADQARGAQALQDSVAEGRRTAEELRLRSAALEETRAVMAQIDAQMRQLDAARYARETKAQLDEQKSASRIHELEVALDSKTSAMDQATQALEQLRVENARLASGSRDDLVTMQRQLEAEHAAVRAALEERLAASSHRVEELTAKEADMQRQVHEVQLDNTTLVERLARRDAEVERFESEAQELREQNILLASEHQHHLDAQERSFSARLSDAESRATQARSWATAEAKHLFENAITQLERETERAIAQGVQRAIEAHKGPTPATVAAAAAGMGLVGTGSRGSVLPLPLSSPGRSPRGGQQHAQSSPRSYDAPIDAASASLSPRRAAASSPTSSGRVGSEVFGDSGHRSLGSPSSSRHNNVGAGADESGSSTSGDDRAFFAHALSLFKDQLLSNLSSSFSVLSELRVSAESDSLRTEAELLAQVSSLKDMLQAQERLQRDLANKLREVAAAHQAEVGSLRAAAQQEALLLEERANVIRELKRRYKSAKTSVSGLTTSLINVRQALAEAQRNHAAEVAQWRDLSAAELAESVRSTEALAGRRLDAEAKLRRKAEEEAENYVRAAQQSEHRCFLLQQQQAQLVTFFKQQIQQLVRPSSSSQQQPQPSQSAPNTARPLHHQPPPFGGGQASVQSPPSSSSSGFYSAMAASAGAPDFEAQLNNFLRSSNAAVAAALQQQQEQQQPLAAQKDAASF